MNDMHSLSPYCEESSASSLSISQKTGAFCSFVNHIHNPNLKIDFKYSFCSFLNHTHDQNLSTYDCF